MEQLSVHAVGGKVTAPCLSCDKLCADAASELNHPFHRPHPLLLQQSSSTSNTRCVCDFCDETCENLVYRCSCGLNFRIKCALCTFNIAEKNLQELEHVAVQDASVSPEIDGDLDRCWKPLANYVYFSLDCGFKLHKKCVELSLKTNHLCHRTHPLFLQFNSERLSCKICQVTRERGFGYGCLACKFVVHIECLAPLPIIEDKSHQHPFTLLWRPTPFICDACGSEGNYVAYTCSTCSIVVHKKCISLPPVNRHMWHEHRVSHTYFIHKEDFRRWDCVICHDVVDTEYGSYSCADCHTIFHVNCALKRKDWYHIVSPENEDDKFSDVLVNSITNVHEWNDAGEAALIEHFTHKHYLALSDGTRGYADKCCDGCLLPISAPFYHCSLCGFFLHKACAELPRKKILPLHPCKSPHILTTNIVFKCYVCDYLFNGFFYKCTDCGRQTCLQCATLKPEGLICSGHKHPLSFYYDFVDRCLACGRGIIKAFRCRDCNFHLDHLCVRQPTRARHRYDEHLLALTYHEANDYSEYHYCNICEKRRNPNLWFYHCATCDTSVHLNCVLGEISVPQTRE